MQLLKEMEALAARGVAGLNSEAAGELISAILRCQHRDGGFCGLDGEPDIYYSLFARLSLNVLGAEYDRQGLIRWLKAARKTAPGVDRVCAELILLQEGERSKVAAFMFLFRSLFRVGAVDSYKLFLTAFLMEQLLPIKLSATLIKRAAVATLKQRAHTDFNSLGTPRAAVCALLAHRIGDQKMQQRMAELLRQRHLSSGGYGSAAGARADLLSTAVVLFATRFSGQSVDVSANDRAFIELCWQDDALFSAAPDQASGDLEHTFYALLALGCTRTA